VAILAAVPSGTTKSTRQTLFIAGQPAPFGTLAALPFTFTLTGELTSSSLPSGQGLRHSREIARVCSPKLTHHCTEMVQFAHEQNADRVLRRLRPSLAWFLIFGG